MKRNDIYWQKRAKACAAENFDDANQRARAAIRAYQKAIEDIEKRIKNVLKNAEAAGATPNIGASPISLAQRKELFEELNALLNAAKSPQERKRISRLISSLAYEYRITRLEELKAQAEIEIIKATQKVEQLQTEHYTEAFERSYYTTIHDTAERFDSGINFAVLDKRTVEEVLNEPWAGSTFSKRLWKHSDGFSSAVNSIIAGGIASGASVSDMAKELEKYVNSPGDIQAATYRLVRTETAHFAGEADKKAYKEAGTPDYRVVETLDSRTCSLCGSMDGKVFPVSQAATGKNYPPFHPNCRGTTIAERSAPKTRIARDPQTGKNYTVDGSMTYEEWLESLTPEQKTALEKNVRILRNKSADKKQYERYKERLGAKNVPKTFDKFQDLKYNDSEKWEELKKVYREVNWQLKAQENLSKGEVHKVAYEGKPNSVFDNIGKNGKVISRRYYGKTGKPRLDIDLTNHNNPKRHKVVPHYHGWKELQSGEVRRDTKSDNALELWHKIANKDILE